MIRNLLLAAGMTLGLCASSAADNLGKPLPAFELEGFTQSPAASFEELTGRVVLVEFFAYW